MFKETRQNIMDLKQQLDANPTLKASIKSLKMSPCDENAMLICFSTGYEVWYVHELVTVKLLTEIEKLLFGKITSKWDRHFKMKKIT